MVREALTSEDKATNFNEANNKLNLTQTSSSIGKTLLNTKLEMLDKIDMLRNNTNSLLSSGILSQSNLLSSAKLSLPKGQETSNNANNNKINTTSSEDSRFKKAFNEFEKYLQMQSSEDESSSSLKQTQDVTNTSVTSDDVAGATNLLENLAVMSRRRDSNFNTNTGIAGGSMNNIGESASRVLLNLNSRTKCIFELSCQSIFDKQNIEQDDSLSSHEKLQKISQIRLETNSGPVAIEDLALTFTYAPSSNLFGYTAAELLPNGSNIDVDINNIEEYCDLTVKFCLQDGIAKQLTAFHKGFCEVFPLSKLAAFSPEEARKMICGEQNPQWTREELMNYTEPKLGYNKDR